MKARLVIPKGWRRLQTGTPLKPGDRYFFGGYWLKWPGAEWPEVRVTSVDTYIRRQGKERS